MSHGRTRTRLGPLSLEDVPNAGLYRSEPESTRQTELHRRGGERDRIAAVFDQGGDAFGRAEVGLLDDTGFAIHTGAFDDVVIELVGFLLGDQGNHNRVIQEYSRSDRKAIGKATNLYRNVL